MKMAVSSRFWRVLVNETNEEKVFNSLEECKTWVAMVHHTANDPAMTFVVTEVSERNICLSGEEVARLKK